MRFRYVLFLFLLIIFSCSKKQKEIKDMKIQEPDFSEMIRKSDSIRRQGKKEITIDVKKQTTKEVPEEILNTTPIIAAKKIVKQPSKKIVKKAPKVVKSKTNIDTSGLIYTVQIAAVDQKSKKYSTINNVITYNENSLVKYSLGRFKTIKEANKFRKQINKKFKGAFVKALKNNVPVSIK